MNATLEIPVNLRFGNLTVTQDDRTISRLELPTKDQTPMVIPLAGTKVTGNSVSLTLTATVLPLENYCWDPLTPIRLVNGSITFTGGEVAPKTIADFLPPVIRKLTIVVPPKPTQQETDAAVQLAAALEDRYGGQNPQVAVEALYDRSSTAVDPSLPSNGRSSSERARRRALHCRAPRAFLTGDLGDRGRPHQPDPSADRSLGEVRRRRHRGGRTAAEQAEAGRRYHHA